jgi:hypothetical protein
VRPKLGEAYTAWLFRIRPAIVGLSTLLTRRRIETVSS